jgi:putative ABC transport system permease protein
MALLIRLALRNARRNVRRTLLTMATVLIGTSLVVLATAWLEGIFGGMLDAMAETYGHIRIVDTDFLEKEALAPMYENVPDAEKAVAAAKSVDGVVAAYPRILTGALMAKGEELGEDFGLVMGASADWYVERLKGPEHVIAGTWLTGKKDEVVLGRKLAQQLDVTVGDEVLLLGQTQYGSMSDLAPTVVGVVSADVMVDNQAYLNLEDAQWMLDLEGGALEVLVYGAGTDAATLAPIADQLAVQPDLAGTTAQMWLRREPIPTMQPMVDGMSGFIAGLVLFITSLAIFNTMTMSVMERTGEIGVMRAMGLSRMGAVALFAVESGLIGLAGGIGGALLGGAAGMYLQVYGVSLLDQMGSAYPMTYTFYASVTASNLTSAVMLGIFIALFGALLPAWRAGRIQPVTAMKARR